MFGIGKLRDTLGIAISNMLFIGDATFPGGNDYPAKHAEVTSIRVRDAEESKRVVILTPTDRLERDGVVENVVFPTGIDCRNDIGQPDRFDVYYGMADSRIGVARMTVPERLPTSPQPRTDSPNAIVLVEPQVTGATS